MITAPLFDAPSGVLAIPVGIAFGAALERAGLGSARTIADQLRARDFTVLKVMFSTIVTAMLGIYWSSRLGWLDLTRVAIPSTDVIPQLIGAVLFGAGFALASLCPGTACVSAATGKRDGLVTIAGLFAGTLVVSLFWSQLGPIAQLAPSDHATLASDLGISAGIVVAAITVVALAAMAIADRITGASGSLRLSPLAAVALTLAAVAIIPGRADPANVAPGGSAVEVSARDLAEWIRARAPHLRIIDIRENLAPDDYRIPGAVDKHVRDLAFLSPSDSVTTVVYGDRDEDAMPAARSLALRGFPRVLVLRGGVAAWDRDIMAPLAPDPSDSGAMARFQSLRELSAWFGGKPTRDSTAPGIRSRRKQAC